MNNTIKIFVGGIMNDSRYINLQGNLIDTAKQLDLSTIPHAREIQKDSWTNKSLCSIGFWTADFPLYTIEDNEAILYLANREHNLILNNIKKAGSELVEKNNYFPKNGAINDIINSDSTLRTNLKELKLIEYIGEWSYYVIYTASKKDNEKYNYDLLNPAQRALAEKVYGIEEDFERSMDELKKSGVRVAMINTLKPEYVKEKLKENNSQGLARISYLNNSSLRSDFKAGRWGIDKANRYLRGIPLTNTEKK